MVDPASLQSTYADNDAHLAELFERWPGGGFTDQGVSIHVWGTDDEHEYLRFDVFDDEPHYHYNHHTAPDGDEIVNNVIDFDTVAMGDMLPWVLDCLRTRLAPMLTEAGGAHLVAGLDRARVDDVVRDVEAMAVQARTTRRP